MTDQDPDMFRREDFGLLRRPAGQPDRPKILSVLHIFPD